MYRKNEELVENETKINQTLEELQVRYLKNPWALANFFMLPTSLNNTIRYLKCRVILPTPPPPTERGRNGFK